MFRSTAITLVLCAIPPLFFMSQLADATTLIAMSWDQQQLYEVDTNNLGSPQLIGTLSGNGALTDPAMLATASATELYMTDRADNRLLTVDRATAAIVSAVTLDADIATAPRGLALSPDGILYAVIAAQQLTPLTLRTVNSATGQTTVIAQIFSGGIEALAFAPDGTLYAAGAGAGGNSNTLYRLNRVTGALTTVALLHLTGAGPGLDIDDLAYGPDGFLYGADSESGQLADLYRIDPNSGAFTNLGSTGVFALNGLAAAAIPIPPAAWLFGGALVALSVLKRRQVMGS